MNENEWRKLKKGKIKTKEMTAKDCKKLKESALFARKKTVVRDLRVGGHIYTHKNDVVDVYRYDVHTNRKPNFVRVCHYDEPADS